MKIQFEGRESREIKKLAETVGFPLDIFLYNDNGIWIDSDKLADACIAMRLAYPFAPRMIKERVQNACMMVIDLSTRYLKNAFYTSKCKSKR